MNSRQCEKRELAEWLVADGELVEEGQPIYALETDKSVQDVEAPVERLDRLEREYNEARSRAADANARERARTSDWADPSGGLRTGVFGAVRACTSGMVERAPVTMARATSACRSG